MRKNTSPPTRKIRPDRRISLILPAAYVPWINEDLARGWTVTGVVLAALALAYPNAALSPKKGARKGA